MWERPPQRWETFRWWPSRRRPFFTAGGTTLRVTLVSATAGAPYTILGWEVPDIAATINALTLKGVLFLRYEGMGQDALGVWRTPDGARIAWFSDPDANVLSLTQR